MIIVDKSLNRLDAFRPENMSLNLEERKSSATMTLGPSAPTLNVGDWLLDDEEPGAGIVWRIKTIDTQYNTNTRTVSLEHIINTLNDTVIFGEVKTSDIAGSTSATNCTALQAARKALSYQTIWVLGDFEYNVSNPYSFNSDSVFSALETITSSLPDACWVYDLTRIPFRISIKRIPPLVSSEMRMDRNIQTLKRTVDRSRMYTRIYPIGQNNINVTGDYISKNENLYGTISVVETDQSKTTEAELKQWATDKLYRHCEPSVTVQISGLELSAVTGESIDHFQINTRCRVPLPEFNTTIIEKVTKLSWSDKCKEPEKVTVTLANTLEDVASIVNSNTSSSKSNAKASAKKDEEDHAWFVDTSDHVGMVAEALLGPDENGVDWSRVSSLIVDGLGIHAQVKRTDGRVTSAETKIDMNEEAITLESKRASKAEGELSGRITVTANAITQEVTRATSAEDSLSGRITTEADRISLVVEGTGSYAKIKPAQIVASINGSSSSVLISADKIRLDGNTTVSGMLTVENGALKVKNNAFINGDLTLASDKEVFATNYRVGGYLRFPGSTMGSDVYIYRDDVENMIVNASVSGNTLSLWKRGDPEQTPSITFSKATTLGGEWSGGTLKVTASPQGTVFRRTLSKGTVTWSGNWAGASINALYGDSGQYSESTDWTCWIDATSRYNAGWGAAYAKVDLPHDHTSAYGDNILIYTPPSTVDGTANTAQYNLTADNSYAYIKNNGNAKVLARISIAIAKSEIALTRGSVTSTEPSADAELLKITAKGWYKLSVTVRGVTKTFKLHIDT